MTQTVPGFDRLTVEPDKLGGQPCIRGFRFGAAQFLELFAAGMTFEEVCEDFPFLAPEDAREVFAYAAALAQRDFYLPPHESA
ncbi:DUF433 domain-containing protein [Nocardioides sp. NPDC023903]|uniref:DUF433 domain-containing protein n=1 Tax=Nocardioides sp. NPDC023903 TaxID=3157195 RepID=UPI0033E1584A